MANPKRVSSSNLTGRRSRDMVVAETSLKRPPYIAGLLAIAVIATGCGGQSPSSEAMDSPGTGGFIAGTGGGASGTGGVPGTGGAGGAGGLQATTGGGGGAGGGPICGWEDQSSLVHPVFLKVGSANDCHKCPTENRGPCATVGSRCDYFYVPSGDPVRDNRPAASCVCTRTDTSDLKFTCEL